MRRQTIKKLRVVLIKPSKYDDEGYVLRYWKGILPSNTLATLFSLTDDVRRRGILGPDLQWDLRLIDDSVQRVDVKRIARLGREKDRKTIVCLVGVQTNQFPRAADLALQFRNEGLDVLIGGFHVSGSVAMLHTLPAEIQALIDAGVTVVLGEVEGRWEEVLRDALDGNLQPVYDFLGSLPELSNQPLPEIHKRYLRHFITSDFGTIDCGRGCPFNCSFCTIINVQGRRMRCRDADLLVRTVRDNYLLKGVSFYFLTDDNFARNKHWEAILDGFIKLREEEGIPVECMMQVDVLSYKIPDFVEKAKRAGCSQVFIGLESLNPANLKAAGKFQNKVDDAMNLVAAYDRAGIMTHVGYIIGFPFDTPASVAEDVRRLKHDLGVKQASFFVLTPLPGSQDHLDLVRRGDYLDPDLNRYDSFHVTTRHPLMSDEEWEKAYADAWRSFYDFENMQEVLLRTPADRYWDVFKNIIWYKNSVGVEGQHPMVAGFLRRKERRTRRPGYEVEPVWRFLWRRMLELKENVRRWVKLFLEMEELWLQTRRRSEWEQAVVNEIRTLRADVREWRKLRVKELQEAHRRAAARVKELLPPAHLNVRIPSRVSLFVKKLNILSDKLTFSRASLDAFWSQTLENLRRGKLQKIRPHQIAVNALRDVKLSVHFLCAMFATGIR